MTTFKGRTGARGRESARDREEEEITVAALHDQRRQQPRGRCWIFSRPL